MKGNGAGRPPRRSGDPHEDAVAELRRSMAGRGFTLDKLADMPAVLDLPIVAQARAAAPPHRGLHSAWEAVVAAARDLGGSLQARVLRVALGIDYDGDAKDLTERRAQLVRAHNAAVHAAGGRNFLAETPRAMYEIEQTMLEALVTALGSPAPHLRAAAAAEPESPLSLWGDAWLRERVDVTCRFTGRAMRIVEGREWLVAGADGLDEFRRAYGSDTDAGTPARFELLDGGEVVDDRPLGRPNFRVVTIRLPRALRAGERHRIRFDVRYPGRRFSEPPFCVRVMRPTNRIEMSLAFDEVPARVWELRGVPTGAAAGDAGTSRPLEPDRLGFAEVMFDEPRQGLSYGVGWSWSELAAGQTTDE